MNVLHRTIIRALLCILALGCGLSVSAQTRRAIPQSIFEALEGEVAGEGIIIIEQSTELRNLVGGVSARFRGILGREGNTTILQGFRIQVYNGNRPASKREAEHRAAQIRRLAPEYKVYITYNAPFWRLVVGDFLSNEEARDARSALLKTLPSWFRESYIVRDKVRIVNYTPDLNEQ